MINRAVRPPAEIPLNNVVQELRVGKPGPVGASRVLSSIPKKLFDRPLKITRFGFEGDGQADTKRHGGPEKAAHQYDPAHYPFWRTQLPQSSHLLQLGGFGENITITGLSESNICIGDIVRMGTATLQVSQGRQPCWKLNEYFRVKAMASLVQESLKTGWYYRVIEGGFIAAGDDVKLVDRPEPTWSVLSVMKALYKAPLQLDALKQLANIKTLTKNWRSLAQARLDSGRVEDWSRRLHTPTRR